MNQSEIIPNKIYFPKEIIEGIARKHQLKKKTQKIHYTPEGKPVFNIKVLIQQLTEFNASLPDKRYEYTVQDFKDDKYERALGLRNDEFYVYIQSGKKMLFPDLLAEYAFNKKFDDLRKDYGFSWPELEYIDGITDHPFLTSNSSKNYKAIPPAIFPEQTTEIESLIEKQLPNYLSKIVAQYSKIFVPQYEKETAIDIRNIIQIGIVDHRPKEEEEEEEEDKEEETLSNIQEEDSIKDITDANTGVAENVINEENRNKEIKSDNKIIISENKNVHRRKTPISNYSIINIIDDLSKIIIVADAGAGKSTLTRWAAFHLTELKIGESKNELPIPVYIQLKWYTGNLIKDILKELSDHGLVLTDLELKLFSETNRLIFILDGLDELSTKSFEATLIRDIHSLNQSLPLVKVLITSRKIPSLKEFYKEGYVKFNLRELTINQIEDFLEKYLTSREANEFFEEIKNNDLETEIKNPLILTFMITEFKMGTGLQTFANKGLLFRNVITHYFIKQWEWTIEDQEEVRNRNIDVSDVLETLFIIAFEMLSNNSKVSLDKNQVELLIARYFSENRNRKDDIDLAFYVLNRLIDSNLLIKKEDEISFWIKSYRDYFAAEYLAKRYLMLDELENKRAQFQKTYGHKSWEECLSLMIGLVDNPNKFIKTILPSSSFYWFNFKRNKTDRLSIAAKCIGANKKISEEGQMIVTNQIIELINDWYWSGFKMFWKYIFKISSISITELYQMLGNSKSSFALSYLFNEIKKSADDLYSVHWEQIKRFPVTNVLLNELMSLQEKGIHVSGVYRHLSENMTPLIINYFLDRIDKNNPQHEFQALNFFSVVGKHEKLGKKGLLMPAIEKVVACYLKTDDHDIGKLCKSFYEQYSFLDTYDGTQYACELFLKELNNENERIRIIALTGIPGSYYIDNDIVNSAILRTLINDSSTGVKTQALYTLSFRKLERSELKNEIFNVTEKYLSWDESVVVRGAAARILGKIKAVSKIDDLKMFARQDNKLYSQSRAIWAVLNIEPEFINEVISEQWELYYFNYISFENIESAEQRLCELSFIGTQYSLDFLKRFQELNMADERYKKIEKLIDEVIRDIIICVGSC